MKKFMAKMGFMVGMIAVAGTAMAANPETLTLRVTPGVTRDISLSSALYDFGSVNLGVSTVSVSAITVSHGPLSNVASTYALRTTGSAAWGAGAAAAVDTFNLRALFHGSQPAPADFLANDNVMNVLAPGTSADAATSYTTDGTYEAQAVPVGTSRDLWFMLSMPSTSSTSAQQDISVIITAVP